LKNLIESISDSLNVDLSLSNYLVIGSAFGKKTILLFRENERTPYLVVKIPEDEEGGVRCKMEYDGLGKLSLLSLKNVICSHQVGIIKHNEYTCYVQTYEASSLLLNKLNLITNSPNEEVFLYVTEQLVDIYKTSLVGNKQPGVSYYRCFQHGDFWMGNLGVRKNKLVLYDLEFSSNMGLPLYDLIHFGLYYCRVADNVGKVGIKLFGKKAVKENRKFNLTSVDVACCLLGDSELANVMRKCIKLYVDKCGISRQDARKLIVDYIEFDRGIQGLNSGWIEKVM